MKPSQNNPANMNSTDSKVLSIVIITKDTEELLKNLLSSIDKESTLKPFLKEVIIVDNASTDSTGAIVKKEFPEFIYIKNEKNEGFAVAVNKGFLHSRGEYIFLLNSDTILIKGEVVKLLELMKQNNDIGISGPRLVYPDMSPQRSFAYIPSLTSEIIPRFLMEFLFPDKASARPSMPYIPSSILNVPSLIGAAILIRRSVLVNLGGFDERFFFFLEETDFCLRTSKMKCNGEDRTYRVVFYPDAKIIHLQGKTVSRNWVQGRIEYNISLYKFIKKHHNYLYYLAFITNRFFKCCMSLILFSILPLLPVKEKFKRSYKYYAKLFLWHINGCPDNSGLRE